MMKADKNISLSLQKAADFLGQGWGIVRIHLMAAAGENGQSGMGDALGKTLGGCSVGLVGFLSLIHI